MHKQSQARNSFPISHRQPRPQYIRASSCVAVFWNNKLRNFTCSLPTPPSTSCYCLAQHSMVWSIPGVIWHPLSRPRSLSAPHAPPTCLSVGQGEEQSSSWCCASAAQQWLKHGCVIIIVLVRNPKPSIAQATMKKTSPSNQHNWETVVIRWRLYPVALQHQGCCSSLPLDPTSCDAEQVLPVDTHTKHLYAACVHRWRDTHKHSSTNGFILFLCGGLG